MSSALVAILGYFFFKIQLLAMYKRRVWRAGVQMEEVTDKWEGVYL